MGNGVSGAGFQEWEAEGGGLGIALERTGCVAKIVIGGIALDVANALVGGGEFAREARVVGGIGSHGVELLEGGLDNDFAGGGGARQGSDGIVEIEQEAAGEKAEAGETIVGQLLHGLGLGEGLLGGEAEAIGLGGLLAGVDGGPGESGDDGESGDEGEPGAAGELASAVEDGVAAGEDGVSGEEAAEVVSEGFRGTVAAGGLRGHGLQHDVVEVEGDALGSRGTAAGGSEFRIGQALEGGGVWGDIGEQLIEDGAEAIDVGGGGDGVAAELLGARILGREEELGDGLIEIGGDELGDAEIEEAGVAAVVDQDVAGLDVAMDNEALVGVGDGFGYLEEELAALVRGEVEPVGVVGNGFAIDVLHDEEGTAIGHGAAIEKACGVGVIELSEDLAFAAETFGGIGTGEAGAEDLYGNEFVELGIVAFGEEDGAHAAGAQGAEDAVGTDAIGLEIEGRGGGGPGGGGAVDDFLEGEVLGLIGGQETADFDGNGGIERRKEAFAGCRGKVRRLMEEFFDLLPIETRHELILALGMGVCRGFLGCLMK